MTSSLTTIAQDTQAQLAHKVLDSTSLFFRDDAANSDKEYHAQFVKVEPDPFNQDRYNVSYQYGKRGCNLVTGELFDTGVSRWAASDEYQRLVASKRKKGYRSIDMSRLNEVYQQMSQMGLDSAGFDLFMSARGKVISLADYFRKNQATSGEGQYAFVASYEAARAVGTVLAGVGMSSVNEKEAARDAGVVSSMLSRMELSRASIFLGRQEDEDGKVEPYYESDRRMMMVPAKKKSTKP